MPKIPIPQDWDGVTWRCIQVQWPNSDQYQAIFHGLLSYLMRGRLYDEKSGTIIDAQAIGQEIWDRNTPLTSCTGEVVPGPILPPVGAGAGGGPCWGDCEDDLMPCIDISNLLKIEGGVLYARDSCCEWIAIGDLAVQSSPVDDPYYDPETPATYYPCGRAKAVLDITYAVAEAAWECQALYPNFWVGHVRAAAPGYNLGTNQIISAVMQGIAVALLFGENQVFDPAMRQTVLCNIAPLFEENGLALSLDNFKEIKGAVRAVWSSAGLGKSQIGGFFVKSMDALGHTDISNASVLGATDASADCTCPEDMTELPFPEDEMLYNVIFGMESVEFACPYGDPVKTFNAETVTGSRIRGYGETTTDPNQTCDMDVFDEPGISILAGDEVWALCSIYSKGGTTSFNLNLGFTQHRDGGDTEALADPYGDDDEVPAIPYNWAKLWTFAGDPATLTRVYGAFHWYADGESLDFRVIGLVIRRP
jgi:hypothetical protein